MTRMLISLEENDRRWLKQKAQETGVPMSEVVRRAIRQAQENGQKPMKVLLGSTAGLWRKGDGLRYQRRIRKEWR
jgi:Ribbon-helix-helix protein, copG family